MEKQLSQSGKILLFFLVLCILGLSFKPREKERSKYPPTKPFRFSKPGNPLLKNTNSATSAFPIKNTGFSSQNPENSAPAGLAPGQGKPVGPSLSKPQKPILQKETTRILYPSDQEKAEIGYIDGKNFDNPEDNLFKIQLEKTPATNQRTYLTYDLYGVSDKSGVSRSINERPSRGGYQVKTNTQWTHQKEEIDPLWLQQGENRIHFSVSSGADYGYLVKNLKIEVESPQTQDSKITIESCGYTLGDTYIKGFVKPEENRAPSEATSLEINGQKVSLCQGEFETIIPGIAGQIEINLLGEKIQQTTTIIPDKPDYQYPLDLDISRIQDNFTQENQENTLKLKGAELQAAGTRLLTDKKISVQNLRTVDVPALDMGLENVTSQAEGYRFLPHGEHFALPGATVKLAYDRTRIPNGYTEQDIKTYYFDLEAKHWVALERDSIDIQNQLIISKTTHFTDMINGVIKTPESPETAGYTPTSLSGITTADPLAKVNLVTPPTANNKGNAGIGYTFEMPPARNAMSPSLGIQYNSDGGSGWLGEGWDLSIPGISVDTRWGVPRYDSGLETETYQLDGSQLVTRGPDGESSVAHRGEKIPRESDRFFFPRKEGSFAKIQRKGNSPENYTWEITDRKGTRYTYGGNNGIVKGSFTNPSEQTTEVIAEWKLSRIEELHGDYIDYIYEQVEESVKGGLTSQAVYLKQVRAGNKGEDPHTVVELIRNQQKQKQQSSARYGFLTSQNQLLSSVEVNFEGQKLREYTFTYKSGEFFTDLLDKIIHKDDQGQEFTHNSFEYYNDVEVAGGYFKNEETWNTHDDGISAGFINPISQAQTTGDFSDKATALGGSKGTSTSGSVYVGIGPLGDTTTTLMSGGFSFGYSYSENKGLSTLVDINGDGIPDKVFVDGSAMYYRPGTTEGTFGNKITIQGINQFSTSYANATNFGSKATIGVTIGATVGAGTQTSRSKTSRYFIDVNGDGLVDLVAGSTVYFNHITQDAQGNLIPTFTQSSGDTPSPIQGGGTIDDSDTQVDPQEQADLIANNPLQDVVRVWVAPYDGTVTISGTAQLQAPTVTSPTEDGVRIAVQLNGQELTSQLIAAYDYSVKNILIPGITVEAGDKIYFRLQSGTEADSNGENDQVDWNQEITYTSVTTEDPNGHTQAYNSSLEGIVSDDGITVLPVKDTYTVEGTFEKPVTTDHLTLKVTLGDSQVVYEHTFTDQETFTGELTIPVTNTVQADRLQFLIRSSSQIAWEKISWKPTINYTDIIEGVTVESHIPASVKYEGIYPQVFKIGDSQTLQNQGTAVVTTHINFKSTATQAERDATNGDYILTLKKQTGLLYQGVLKITDGVITQGSPISVSLPAGELWVELFSEDTSMEGLEAVESISTQISDTLDVQTQALTSVYYRTADNRFGPLHRNWGQFSYNAMEGRAQLPIQEALLKLPEDEDEADPRTQVFIPMHPDIQNKTYWEGDDIQVFISGSVMSSSRLGQKEVKLDNPLSGLGSITDESGSCITGSGAVGIGQESLSTSTTVMQGAFVAIANTSEGNDEIRLAFADMNGDGYPDIASKSQVQLTNTRGGFDGEIVKYSGYHKSKSQAYSLGIGGGPVYSLSVASKKEKLGNAAGKMVSGFILGLLTSDFSSFETAAKEVTEASSSLEKAKNLAFIPSGDISENSDWAVESFTDVNGDGLPDKVLSNKQVQLNLGYAFTSPVNWELTQIQQGSKKDMSLSLGYDRDGSSWSAGIGLNNTKTNTSFTLTDVNSDGLVDKIRVSDSMKVYVSLNKGNTFAPEIEWSGIGKINETSSVGESVNAAYTYGFEFPVPPVLKLVFNPGMNKGNSMSRTLSDFRDVDGDGFPDAVYSDQEDQLQVKRSTIARTNKLQGVKNSIGGSFTLDYSRTEATYSHPGGKWVLTSVEIDDGIHDDGTNTRIEYQYSQGKYDRHEREFLGFGKVETLNLDTGNNHSVYRKTTQEYEAGDYYRAGNQLRTLVEDALGKKYTETLNTYYQYEVKQTQNAGYTLTQSELCSDNQSAYTPLKYTKNLVYEGNEPGMVAQESRYTYDTANQYGELLKYRYSDKGTLGEDATGDYTYETLITYTSNPSKNIYGLPVKVQVVGSDEQLYREVNAVYDTQYANHLTQVRQKQNDQEESVTDIEYDKYGNITRKTLPANHKGERMWYKYRYDNEYHMYLERIDDAYGYTSLLEDYDYRYGIPLSTKDINGYFMETTLDNLGRIVTLTGPNEMELGLPYTIKYQYNPTVEFSGGEITRPAYAVTQHYDPQHPGNDLETISFVDGIGRTLQVKKDGVLIPDPSQGGEEEILIVSGRSKLDPYGRIIESYYPVTEAPSQKLIFNPAFDSITPTRTQYDVLDRVVETILPDSSTQTSEYGLNISQRNLVTTSTDALGGVQAAYVNSSGQTVKTEQLSGPNGTITTQFVYDPIGQLLEVIDTEGQTIVSAYDLAGRRTRMSHPSAGTTTLTYDLLGNVITRQTSNLETTSQQIEYEYEYTRLIKIKYPQHPQNNVTYYYGNKNSKENRVGRVMLQEDVTGAQEFKYGTLGEITEVRRTVVIPNQAIATYVTKSKYDSWNRIEQIIYPDQEKVDYTYNTAGLLTGVRGSKAYSYNYVNKIGYDKFEQRTYLKYCNGAETAYTYDPQRRRLTDLQVWTTPGSGARRQIMDNQYQYDAVSNVLSVANLAALPQNGQNNSGGQMEHVYAYDGLYRLISAEGTYTGADSKTAGYSLEMAYDNLHNITTKKQYLAQENIMFNGELNAGYELAYTYNQTRKNQISVLEDSNYRTEGSQPEENKEEKKAYEYDANGNLVYINTSLKKQDNRETEKTHERKLVWDEENRLRALDDNGYVSNYWYDASGERVVKTSGESELVYVNAGFSGGRTDTRQFSAYVNPYLVVSPGGRYTKHYYIGSQRIVSKLGDMESFGADPRRIEYAGAGLPGVSIDWKVKYQRTIQDIRDNYEHFEVPYHGVDNDDYVNGQGFCCGGNSLADKTQEAGPGNGNINYEVMQYYYHGDHLGSSSYITNLDGEVVQHVEYVPFGEVFLEERNNTWNSPYLFNGKELDEETGLYYYGARYYNPRESVWLSTDPLSGYNPVFETEHYIDGQHNGGVFNERNLNPYSYTYQNPVTMIDPNGKQAHFMHGTGNWNASTYFLGEFENRFKARFGTFDSWKWSGSLWDSDNRFWNGKEGRINAGHRIAKNIMTSIKKNIAGGKYVGLGIAIGGHSHGANVARVAAKDVYSELNQMVQAGTLDKIPPINLVMVNAPILNDKAYEFSANELLYINTIQVDSKVDIVAGAGQELIGIFGTNEFYSDTAHKIEYEDQLKFDWIGCGVSNHCGHADENVKVWYPKVDKELK